MSIIVATVEKPNKDSKVGIDFTNIEGSGGKLFVCYIGGLFASTEMEIGYEVISINKVLVGNDTTPDKAKAVIGGITGKVVIEAIQTPKIIVYSTWKPPQNKHAIPRPREYTVLAYKQVPKILKDAGVSVEKWNKLVNYVKDELMTKVSAAESYKGALNVSYGNHVKSQVLTGEMIGGFLGATMEASKERDAFMMHSAAAAAHTNVALSGANVLAKATALVVPHGIMAELVTTTVKPFENNNKKSWFYDDTHVVRIPVDNAEFTVPIGLQFSKV